MNLKIIPSEHGAAIQIDGSLLHYYRIYSANSLGQPEWTLAGMKLGEFAPFVWDAAQEDIPSTQFYRVEEIPRAISQDTDEDGMNDVYELLRSFLNPMDHTDAQRDDDMDQLSNLDECQNGTNPSLADTDEDGVPDGVEVLERKTNPNDPLSVNATLYIDPIIGSDALDGLSPVVTGNSGPKETLAAAFMTAYTRDEVSIATGEYRMDVLPVGDKSITLRPEGTVTIRP
ncbi:MAG TPA: hypothetical protein DCZ95_01440 [Verrucomicrobia bacterium]|nr:hypothetical protein [Verrucomicrobiota bacterium]